MIEILALLIGLIIIYLIQKRFIFNSYNDGAPFITTSVETLEQAITMLNIQPGEVFYELGSGDGRAVIYAAMKGSDAFGIEINWLRVMYSRIWIFLLRLTKHAEIIHANFFDVSLKDADIVFMYLLPITNQKLEAKLKSELKPGSKVVSIGFPFPNWKPVKSNPVIGPIFLYQI